MSSKYSSADAMLARASSSTYAAIVGPWIAIGALWVFAAIRSPGSDVWLPLSLLAAAIAGTAAWVRGHLLVISEGALKYRDGLYKQRVVRISEIERVEYAWKTFTRVGRAIEIPCIVVHIAGTHEPIVVNPKVFSRASLARMESLLAIRKGASR
jgi:hypothetical protein